MARLLATVSALALAMALPACGEGEGETPPPATTGNEPAIGSPAWGEDGCLYAYSGNETYSPTETCRRRESTGSVAYFKRSEPTNVLYYEYGGYVYYDYNGLNARRPAQGGGLIEVEQGGQWTSLARYAGAVAQEQAAAAAAEEAANAAEERELAEAQRLEIEQQFQETQNRIMDRILAPACNSSYNGCG